MQHNAHVPAPFFHSYIPPPHIAVLPLMSHIDWLEHFPPVLSGIHSIFPSCAEDTVYKSDAATLHWPSEKYVWSTGYFSTWETTVSPRNDIECASFAVITAVLLERQVTPCRLIHSSTASPWIRWNSNLSKRRSGCVLSYRWTFCQSNVKPSSATFT